MTNINQKQLELNNLLHLIQESLLAGRPVRFSPRGISMLPMLRQGVDCVVLAPTPEKLRKYDIPFYQRENGKFVLHRIVKVNAETYDCIGDNQFEVERGVRHEQVIAVVCGFTRGAKEHRVDEWGYRTYCWFWHYSRPIRFCGRMLRCLYRRAKGWIRRHFL